MSPLTLDDYQRDLEKALAPSFLQVHDASAAHAGHAGAQQAGPVSHLSIRVCADCLQGLPSVAQHQKVYEALWQPLSSGALHAVQIEVLDTPPPAHSAV